MADIPELIDLTLTDDDDDDEDSDGLVAPVSNLRLSGDDNVEKKPDADVPTFFDTATATPTISDQYRAALKELRAAQAELAERAVKEPFNKGPGKWGGGKPASAEVESAAQKLAHAVKYPRYCFRQFNKAKHQNWRAQKGLPRFTFSSGLTGQKNAVRLATGSWVEINPGDRAIQIPQSQRQSSDALPPRVAPVLMSIGGVRVVEDRFGVNLSNGSLSAPGPIGAGVEFVRLDNMADKRTEHQRASTQQLPATQPANPDTDFISVKVPANDPPLWSWGRVWPGPRRMKRIIREIDQADDILKRHRESMTTSDFSSAHPTATAQRNARRSAMRSARIAEREARRSTHGFSKASDDDCISVSEGPPVQQLAMVDAAEAWYQRRKDRRQAKLAKRKARKLSDHPTATARKDAHRSPALPTATVRRSARIAEREARRSTHGFSTPSDDDCIIVSEVPPVPQSAMVDAADAWYQRRRDRREVKLARRRALKLSAHPTATARRNAHGLPALPTATVSGSARIAEREACRSPALPTATSFDNWSSDKRPRERSPGPRAQSSCWPFEGSTEPPSREFNELDYVPYYDPRRGPRMYADPGL
ncbi:hypothetical protein HDU86_004136 [Geranomyces michiganensis]|nr:hypothetical protein HDU86_004136 [Geranomyces michiganensis]